MYVLILWPLKDKVIRSSVTEPDMTVTHTHTHTLQTEPMDRAVTRLWHRVRRECRLCWWEQS